MTNVIRVVLAEDNEIYLKGLTAILESLPGIVVSGAVADGEALLQCVDSAGADAVVTDIEMPRLNGIEATRVLTQRHPQLPVIALTMHRSEQLVVEMLEAGAKGYLDKDSREEDLAEAIGAVHRGLYYYCPTTLLSLSKLIARSKHLLQPQPIQLSEQEKEIVRLVCAEYSSKEIAPMVHLSVKTVETYRLRIQDKMKVRGTAGMIVYALRNGLCR